MNRFEPQRDALASELAEAKARVAELEQHVRHDYECELHILQRDDNEARGIKRQGEHCTCGLEAALATEKDK